MTRIATGFLAVLLLVGWGARLVGQDNATVRAAAAAYENLEFAVALTTAQRAVTERLSQEDLAQAYEILAFSYAALDSTRQSVEAFRELIFLDPDREPNVERVSPRITSLYASALGQVLVVRGLRVDSASFVGGTGGVPIQYRVSRPARVFTRIVGDGVDAIVDSQLVAGVGGFRWDVLRPGGEPVPAGDYTLMVTAREGQSEFTGTTAMTVRHGRVDTVPHITSLPGYSPLPESEVPPRDWRPVGVAFLYAGLSTGAAFALSDSDLGTGWRGPAIGVSLTALAAGIAMTVKRPDPRPVPANIRYNELLAVQIAQRNADIARDNAERRRQTLLTITPVSDASGGGQ
jgi:tetratricopeptide (TPR) repeat protein